jgi:hypothetical protein
VAPELSRFPVTVPGPVGKQDPLSHSGCVPLGDRFFVKFAWSHPAALRLAREISVLAALAREPKVPFLPEVVASSADPLLMITRRVPGTSRFEVADSINPDNAARIDPNRHPQLTSADGTGEDRHTAPRRQEVRQAEAMRQTFRRDGGRSLLTGKP